MEEFYKKKNIRDFLTLFSESKWKSLCILVLEYGILSLRLNYKVSSLSMEDIQEYVDELKDNLKKINKQNTKKIRDINNEMVNNVSQKTSTNNKRYSATGFKPSSDWRKGEEKTIFDVDPNNNNENYVVTKKENKILENSNNNFTNSSNKEENIYNYHYTNNNQMRNEIKNFYEDNKTDIYTKNIEREEQELKKKREKIMSDILYPKGPKAYQHNYKDNVMPNNFTAKQQSRQYRTTYGGDYRKNNEDCYKVNKKHNIRKQGYAFRDSRNSSMNSSFNDGFKASVRSNSSNKSIRFKSGLQKLKLTTPLEGKNKEQLNRSFSKKNVMSFNKVGSKIKAQVEADKKIYELMKKNKNIFY